MDEKKIIDDDVILVGDKVDLVTRTGAVYRTMIEDRLGNGPYLAGIPHRKGVHMYVGQDDDIYVVFYRESGRYIAHMKVVALEKRGEIRYMWLAQKSMAQKNQRREAFRLPVSFNVQIYEVADDTKKQPVAVKDKVKAIALEVVSSRDISITGVTLLTRRKYELEEKYLLGLHLGKTSDNVLSSTVATTSDNIQTLHLTATVKRCIPWRTTNIFNTGMQFFGMTDAVSDDLARYVLNEQQKQIKRRRRLF